MSTHKVTKKQLLENARPLSIKGAAKMKKTDLVHAIQTAEGNVPCFLTISDCSISTCLYFSECQR